MKQGDTGPAVGRLQAVLRAHGLYTSVVDGDFGPATDQAVRHFQADRGLTVDGIVGPHTWGTLGLPDEPVTLPAPGAPGAGDWVPIVNLAFTREEIWPYIRDMPFGKWRGEFVVLHNTDEPTLAEWHEPPPADPPHRIENLVHFYRDVQGWHAGPHFFVADDLIWAFTPAARPGVHSPSWNTVSWGVEIVGNYDVEPFGEAVRDNAVEVIAALYHRFGLDASTLRFHREDPETTHRNCPGAHVSKENMIARVAARLATLKAA